MKLTWRDALEIVGFCVVMIGAVAPLCQGLGIDIPRYAALALALGLIAAKDIERRLQKRLAETPSTVQQQREDELVQENATYRRLLQLPPVPVPDPDPTPPAGTYGAN